MRREEFLTSMRHLAASVSIISAKDSGGKPYAMTASSVTSLSMEPPSVLVCVNKNAGIHKALSLGGGLCINILSKHQVDIANLCSSKDQENARFENNDWDNSELPFLKEAQSNIFCKIDQIIEYHTHSIVITKVVKAISVNSFNTLMYADGGYLD